MKYFILLFSTTFANIVTYLVLYSSCHIFRHTGIFSCLSDIHDYADRLYDTLVPGVMDLAAPDMPLPLL